MSKLEAEKELEAFHTALAEGARILTVIDGRHATVYLLSNGRAYTILY